MVVRKVQRVGNSVGITLDKEEARFDGILDRIENGEDVHAMISRQDAGEWLVTIPEIASEDDEPVAPRQQE